jgi:sugar phosphate isomerase/epimerase
MKLGISSTCVWNLSPKEAIHFAEKLEIYAFELWADHYFLHTDDVETIRQAYKETDLLPTVHAASWDLNLTSTSKKVRDFSITQGKKSIDLAVNIGAPIITIHPGRKSFFRSDVNDIYRIQRDVFHEFSNYCRGKDLLICIENIEPGEKEVMVTEDDFQNFFSEIDDTLFVTMDLAHLGSYEKITSFYGALGGKVKHIHISDLDSGEIHLPMGEGFLETERIISYLSGSYNGVYSLEFYDMDKNGEKARQSIQYLKKYPFDLK